MYRYPKPAPIEPSRRPLCATSEDHWTQHWTIGDCITHFAKPVPLCLFAFLDEGAPVAGIWPHLTVSEQLMLDEAFVMYDIRTGRI